MGSATAIEMATAHYSEGIVCSSGATIELVGLPWWHPIIVPNPMEHGFKQPAIAFLWVYHYTIAANDILAPLNTAIQFNRDILLAPLILTEVDIILQSIGI